MYLKQEHCSKKFCGKVLMHDLIFLNYTFKEIKYSHA